MSHSLTTGTAARQASLSFTISLSLLGFMSIESVMPSTRLILCHPLLFLPSVFPSIGVFPSESILHIRWPKYWSFSFSISPSSDYSGLISFRIEWFDLLTVQGTLKSILQYHNSKASVLWPVVAATKYNENDQERSPGQEAAALSAWKDCGLWSLRDTGQFLSLHCKDSHLCEKAESYPRGLGSAVWGDWPAAKPKVLH